MSLPPSLPTLIQALDTSDTRAQRTAGDQLVRHGATAAPALREALVAESAQLRKAAAFLLRRVPVAPETLTALEQALLTDAEPKVRKNAAVTLGKLQATHSIDALGTAFRQESYAYVRPSILLALGALGEAARPVLTTLTPQTEAEQTALRKALGRTATARPQLTWDTAWAGETTVYLEVPEGLELVGVAEAEAAGLGPVVQEGPGRIRCAPGTQPWQTTALRCSYATLLAAGRTPLPPPAGDAEKQQAVAALLAQSAPLRAFRARLLPADPPLQYRLAVVDPTAKRGRLRGFKKKLLETVRAACTPLGWTDSPSNYDVELRVVFEAARVRLFIQPYFVPDERFAYRVKDVGAALNPVIAACLVRIVRTPTAGTVFDPTCGSGTLLIERAILGEEPLQVRGLDVSKAAIRAARANIQAAGRSKEIQIAQGNAVDPALWPACDEVMANLPFGLRTAHADLDLGTLYAALLSNLDLRLSTTGQALYYARNKKLFEKTLSRHRAFRIHQRGRVLAGGLWIHWWLLRRSG